MRPKAENRTSFVPVEFNAGISITDIFDSILDFMRTKTSTTDDDHGGPSWRSGPCGAAPQLQRPRRP